MKDKNRVCPLERAGKLDGRMRNLLHNPKKMLGKYIMEGMTVIDYGCGPGFFSVAIAEIVGDRGKVLAVDLQQGMLDRLNDKIRGTPLEKRIELHRCGKESIGVRIRADFLLAFYLLHELPDQKKALMEMKSLLRSEGLLYIAEPIFRVSKNEFRETIERAEGAGFRVIARPWLFMGRAAVLKK
ncbi:MAG: methyltransferase domain-containing protein [Candidatus Aenigmarchaeota archaeon]|nr:methyltransferase domain-containing protein [Candidatus Aenigmarchaeota archaeon]